MMPCRLAIAHALDEIVGSRSVLFIALASLIGNVLLGKYLNVLMNLIVVIVFALKFFALKDL